MTGTASKRQRATACTGCYTLTPANGTGLDCRGSGEDGVTDDVRPVESVQTLSPSDRLDSWKEIGAYLKRDATTVRRWEKREGLPVHRHLHDRRESVYAYRHEIDRWWDERRNHLTADRASGESSGVIGGRERLAWTATALLAMSTITLALILLARGSSDEHRPEGSVVRLSIQPTEPVGDFAFSPDGQFLTFVAGTDGTARLWVRQLDSVTPRLLPGTEEAEAPFWSPDGRFIAFGARGKLKKIAVSGGAVHTICDARVVLGGTWSRDNVIVFTPDNRTPLYRVPAGGGEPVQVTALDRTRGHNTHRWPHFLPDGRRFLYLARSTNPSNSGIYVASLDSDSGTRVISAESRMAYAPPGYLLFARDGALLAQPFDPSVLRVDGEPIQILDDVLYNRDDSYAWFSISAEGDMAYQTSAAVRRSALVWFDRSGKTLESRATVQDAEEPSLSPDGKRLAVSRWMGPSKDIWLIDLAQGGSRMTSHPSVDLMPIWSPDGDSIIFASNRDGPSDLYRMAASGTDKADPVVRSSTVKHPSDWSSTADVVVYDSNDPQTSWDIWTLRLRDGASTPFLQTEFAEGFGRLSPDGRWMAYVSNESGTNEVFLRAFPLSNGKSKVSTEGGTQPRWRRDGKELFYLAPDGKLMSVAVRTGSKLRLGIPERLFESRASRNGEWSYDVTADGQRFVFSVPVGDEVPAPIMVVLNWVAAVSSPAGQQLPPVER